MALNCCGICLGVIYVVRNTSHSTHVRNVLYVTLVWQFIFYSDSFGAISVSIGSVSAASPNGSPLASCPQTQRSAGPGTCLSRWPPTTRNCTCATTRTDACWWKRPKRQTRQLTCSWQTQKQHCSSEGRPAQLGCRAALENFDTRGASVTGASLAARVICVRMGSAWMWLTRDVFAEGTSRGWRRRDVDARTMCARVVRTCGLCVGSVWTLCGRRVDTAWTPPRGSRSGGPTGRL